MGIEKTYIMLKPDCVKRGLMGEVISRIERKGYKIVDAKMMNLDEAILPRNCSIYDIWPSPRNDC